MQCSSWRRSSTAPTSRAPGVTLGKIIKEAASRVGCSLMTLLDTETKFSWCELGDWSFLQQLTLLWLQDDVMQSPQRSVWRLHLSCSMQIARRRIILDETRQDKTEHDPPDTKLANTVKEFTCTHSLYMPANAADLWNRVSKTPDITSDTSVYTVGHVRRTVGRTVSSCKLDISGHTCRKMMHVGKGRYGLLCLCLACRRRCSRRRRCLVTDRCCVLKQECVDFSRQTRSICLAASCWNSRTAVAE